MTRRTALFTIAMLLTFMSTQVVHTTAGEAATNSAATAKPKGKAKASKHRRQSKAKAKASKKSSAASNSSAGTK